MSALPEIARFDCPNCGIGFAIATQLDEERSGEEPPSRERDRSMAHHQRIVLEIIQEEGEITPSDLYDAYRDRADRPKTNRTVRNYLHDLVQEGYVTALGTSRDRIYIAGSVGDTDGNAR